MNLQEPNIPLPPAILLLLCIVLLCIKIIMYCRDSIKNFHGNLCFKFEVGIRELNVRVHWTQNYNPKSDGRIDYRAARARFTHLLIANKYRSPDFDFELFRKAATSSGYHNPALIFSKEIY